MSPETRLSATPGIHTIRRIAVDGSMSTFAGRTGCPGAADGPASQARFFSGGTRIRREWQSAGDRSRQPRPSPDISQRRRFDAGRYGRSRGRRRCPRTLRSDRMGRSSSSMPATGCYKGWGPIAWSRPLRGARRGRRDERDGHRGPIRRHFMASSRTAMATFSWRIRGRRLRSIFAVFIAPMASLRLVGRPPRSETTKSVTASG